MKKLVFVYIALIAVVIVIALFKMGDITSFLNIGGSKGEAQIGSSKLNLTVVKKPNDRMKGLSGRKSLGENDGMLFVFEKKDKYTFWMKGMNFPIDIIFIDDSTVVDLFENVKPPEKDTPIGLLPKYTPSVPIDKVLEVNAGVAKKLNIKKGTNITFKGI